MAPMRPLLFLCGLLCLTANAAARPFTAQDLATVERLSDPRLSPDGGSVLYDLRSVDFAANSAQHSLWLADSQGRSAPRRLAISDGGASSGRWSPDGRWIYFLSGRDGGIDQLWQTDAAGTVARPVTHLPFDVGAFRISPDGKTVVVSQAVFPDCPDLACSQDRLAARKAAKAGGVVFERLFIRHWDRWADGTRNHLFALALDAEGLATGPARDLTPGMDGDVPSRPFGDDGDFAIAPDSRTVTFSIKIAGADEAWSTNFDLFTVPLDGATMPPRNVTAANPAADVTPVYSPDGTWLAYRAQHRPGFESDRYAIMLREVASGRERELAPGWDRSAEQIAWSADGKAVLALAEDQGQTSLFRIALQDGKISPVTGPGHVGGFDVRGDRLAFTADDLSHPAQLYLQTGNGKPKALTRVNDRQLADVVWGEAERFEFPGWNNETVHGYLVKPSGWVAGKRYPVAFLIHGGPQGSFGNLFHYRWNAQTFAGAGYAVVMIDFHGSTGYGQAFTDAISRHWGDRPLEDLQKGWEFALARYPFLDPGRACALGGSYGGYMINWIAGTWNKPWQCLVNHDGIFDTRFMGYSTEELWFSEWENGGTPYQPGNDFLAFNPADHVDRWTTPTLVVEGGKDYRVPLEEAIATFTALQRKGVPSKLLYFEGENHWVLKPQDLVQWYGEVNGWLDRWTTLP